MRPLFLEDTRFDLRPFPGRPADSLSPEEAVRLIVWFSQSSDMVLKSYLGYYGRVLQDRPTRTNKAMMDILLSAMTMKKGDDRWVLEL